MYIYKDNKSVIYINFLIMWNSHINWWPRHVTFSPRRCFLVLVLFRRDRSASPLFIVAEKIWYCACAACCRLFPEFPLRCSPPDGRSLRLNPVSDCGFWSQLTVDSDLDWLEDMFWIFNYCSAWLGRYTYILLPVVLLINQSNYLKPSI